MNDNTKPMTRQEAKLRLDLVAPVMGASEVTHTVAIIAGLSEGEQFVQVGGVFSPITGMLMAVNLLSIIAQSEPPSAGGCPVCDPTALEVARRVRAAIQILAPGSAVAPQERPTVHHLH